MDRIEIKESVFEIYTEENVREKVPESSGIYLLWAKTHKNEWDCIHVGHSNNLKSNLLHHLSKDEKSDKIKSNVQKYICGYEWTIISKAKQ